MNESEFLKLIERYETGQATREERELLERLVDATYEPGGYASLPEDEKEKVRAEVKHELDALIRKEGGAKTRTLFASPWMRMAASFALILGMAYALFSTGVFSTGKRMAHVQTGSNVQRLILSDSSIVWLKPGSSLSYDTKFETGERAVTLVGEALFEVKKDASWPFIITTGDLTTTVRGTSFNIKSTEKSTEVYVLTGAVTVASKYQEEVELVENQKAVYATATKKLVKEQKSTRYAEETMNYVRGTEYSMVFEASKLSDVIERIEKKFNVNVNVSNEAINNCLISADFTDQSLNRTLRLISQALRVEYEIEDSTVTLTGNGCH